MPAHRTGRTAKLTPAQKKMLERAIAAGGSFRAEGAAQENVAERLYARELIGPSIYRGDKWVITDAGRAALSATRPTGDQS